MDQTLVLLANNNPNDIRGIMYESSAPNTPVAVVDAPAPHAADYVMNFIGLNDVSHIFRLFEFTPPATLGAQLNNDFLIQPKQQSLGGEPDIELVVGVDIPGGGVATSWDGTLSHPQFAGKICGVDYMVEQRAIGTLKSDEVDDNIGGAVTLGFKLLNGLTFNDGDTYFIRWIPKLVINPSNYQSNGSKLFKDIKLVTADTQLDATYLNCLIDINSASNKIVITLDDIGNVPDMSFFGFMSNRGNHINAVIKAKPGELIYFNDDEVNEIILGKVENVTITKKGTRFYVWESKGQFEDVGKPFADYAVRKNTIKADGSVLSRAEYPRLWKFVQTLTLGSGVVNDADWNASVNNKFQFSLGDGVTTFRIPDLRGVVVRFLDEGRGLDPDRITSALQNAIGSYQADGVATLVTTAVVRKGASYTGGPMNTIFGNGDAGQQDKTVNITLNGTAQDTHGKNVGLLPLIRI